MYMMAIYKMMTKYSIVWIEWNNLIDCMKIYEASLRLLSECLKIDGYS
jgi:hypothetical protein